MYISLNWLKEYVDIPKDITPQKLGDLLTMHSVEVEEVISQGEYLDGVVVGEILEIKKHPNADKLNIAQVEVGEDKPRQIVFGQMAKMEIGFKVPAALAPTVLPGGFEIKKSKLRGETSEGMLCLDQEMGLAKDGVSIHFFDKDVKNGTPIVDALGLNDVIIDIDNKTITNRPDLWGHYGMAREVAVITKSRLKVKDSKAISEILDANVKTDVDLDVDIKDYELCPRYMGVVVDNIKIAPSPQWMQGRLTVAGVRPINNIVDITNYVMLDLGQPLHAFDYSKIAGGEDEVKVIVRPAEADETITTLDGVERKLDNNILVIADEKKAIAIAGVMGGANSEVDENTTRIVIESANFHPVNNRRTSTKLSLRTEAVMRYEKSLDPNLTEEALNKTLSLIAEIIPDARIVSKVADEKKFTLDQGPITLSINDIQRKIGVELDPKYIVETLESLGFEIAVSPLTGGARGGNLSDADLNVTIPTWRATKDISIAEDLIEEIARVYGYDNIEQKMPLIEMKKPEVNEEREFERKVKNIVTGLGFDEVYNYSFVGDNQIKKLGQNADNYIRLLNSLSREYTMLRQSVLEYLVVNIRDNLRYFEEFKFFEIGSTFKKGEGKYLTHPEGETKLPIQEKFIGGVVVDKSQKVENIFMQTKEAVENLLTKIGIVDYQISDLEDSYGLGAKISINSEEIGKIIILDKNIQDNFDINTKVNCGLFELNFTKLFALPKKEVKYQLLSKFPEVKIDLAIVAPKDIAWQDIEAEIKQVSSKNLKQIELFDIYQGENISADKKSLAMHLSFAQNDRTMEMKEVEALREKIVNHLKNKIGADIRS